MVNKEYKDTIEYKRGYSDALVDADVFFVPDGKNVHRARVYGLRESIRGAKFPKAVDIDKLNLELTPGIRALAMSGYGEGHDQWLTGCIVQFDLTLSNKAWVEAERYHFFDFVSSQSTMHKITKFDFDEVYDSHVDSRIIDVVKGKVDAYNRMLKLTEHKDFKKIPENEQKEALADLADMYIDILMNNPAGCRLTARMTTNYRQLKTIYNQRRNHRLPEWREFCEWMRINLPYSEFITRGRDEEEV